MIHHKYRIEMFQVQCQVIFIENLVIPIDAVLIFSPLYSYVAHSPHRQNIPLSFNG